jgi:GH35 family endo-1,4-beta-xylanase
MIIKYTSKLFLLILLSTELNAQVISDKIGVNFITDSTVFKSSKGLLIGATLNHSELSTKKKELFLKDFKYLTPANAAKQSRIHPKPGIWDWNWINDFLDFSKDNGLLVRMHGPVSPQASKWAKEDHRTPDELKQIMESFCIAFAKKMNKEPNVKWMDVVNETILPNGEWFGPRKGTDKWENPWLKIGLDTNGYPLYILKAFQIATKYAPNVKLVYNQNAGMQSIMWDRVKQTILYIRSKGFRVDGIGWQGHILLSQTTKDIAENTDRELKKLEDLIDWAHQNKLEFHITELDYFVEDRTKLNVEYEKQALIYEKILDILTQKSQNGVVTLNLWDLGVRNKQGRKGQFQSIYNSDLKPTPAYYVVKNAMQN